ncbi:hypothetical protein [Sphingopyxis macrogoltabida]|nr:hypothetical protein [Sphingopyxis macrogoltabida]
MQPAHEQPDTAQTVVDIRLAHFAIAFTFLTIGVPLILAMLR